MDRLISWERRGIDETTSSIIGFINELKELEHVEIELVAIDDTGLGGGVSDNLRHTIAVEPVLFGVPPTEEGREYFANAKAELAWRFRKALDENLKAREAGELGTFGLKPDDRLRGQLTAMRRRYGGHKAVMSILDPDDPSVPASELAPGMRVSPDHAHAAIIAYHAAIAANATFKGILNQPDPVAKEASRHRLSNYIFGRRPRA
jgi:hypothetical protein